MITLKQIEKKLGRNPLIFRIWDYENDNDLNSDLNDLTFEELDFLFHYSLEHPEEMITEIVKIDQATVA